MVDELGSAAVQGMVSGILSNITYEGGSNAKDHMERLEMAHIRLEAALQTAQGWNITSAPLLRWQSKLERAVQECDEMLRRCKKHVREEEEMEQGARNNASVTTRVSHNIRSLVSSIFHNSSHCGTSEVSLSAVRRFERFADGANEFLRFVEFGGTPKQYMFFDPLVRHLFAGKMIKHKLVSGNQHHLVMVQPISTPQGIEGRLLYVLLDGDAPENSFFFTIFLRLSESTDIIGLAVRCLELFAPHFKSTMKTVKTKITQMPTLDFCWVPYVDSSQKQRHWERFYAIFSKWFRPNPHCCRQQQHPYCNNNINSSSLQQDINLEPIIKVYLQGHVPVSEGHNRKDSFPYVKLRLLLSPHASLEGMLPTTVDSSATETVQGQQRHGHNLYSNISFEQLDEMLLPKAIDSLRQNAGAAVYQMIWKSRHGGAYIQAEKFTPRRTSRKERRGQRLQRQAQKVETWSRVVTDFLDTWAAHAPAQLQGSIADWIQKEKKMQLAPVEV